MDSGLKLTPGIIFTELDKSKHDVDVGLQVVANFDKLPNKADFLDPTIKFLNEETDDKVRSWGMDLLEKIGGERAFETAIGILEKKEKKEIKRHFAYSRFFALRAILRMSGVDEDKKKRVTDLLSTIWQDEDEGYLIRSAAAINLAMQRQKEPKTWLLDVLGKEYREYWPVFTTLRSLEEYPLDEISDEVIKVMVNTPFQDHKFMAIKALGKFKNNIKVLRALGNVVATERNEYLRLNAIKSLDILQDPRAKEDLLQALEESNAEVRLRASIALSHILTPQATVAEIVNSALRPEIATENLDYLIDSLRQVDPDRAISAEILSNEMENPDQERAKRAEKILIELGGWAAVTRLSQRRRNLEKLDEFLKQSEQTVTKNYQETMIQARFGFYFAMAINVLIVVIGLILIIIALQHLIQNPEVLEAWILPGATGVLGIMLNLFFNNPRNNAREDMATLLNVSVIFQGYLQELHHIDATFKHMYIENRDFGIDEMLKTVGEIKTASEKTLELVKNNLNTSLTTKKET